MPRKTNPRKQKSEGFLSGWKGPGGIGKKWKPGGIGARKGGAKRYSFKTPFDNFKPPTEVFKPSKKSKPRKRRKK